MPRKRKKKLRPEVQSGTLMLPVEAMLQASRPDPGGLLAWPTLDARQEVSQWDMQRIYRAARSLSYNSTSAIMLLEKMQNLVGWLMPQPLRRTKSGIAWQNSILTASR